MNNKILIPIDFSTYSEKAIDYACALNKISKHDIDLIHVFTNHTNIYHNSLTDPHLIDPQVAFSKRDAQLIIEKYSKEYPTIQFNIIFKEGNLFDELQNTVKNDAYDAIIMGTKGASGLDALLIGSNTFEVFQNANIPVVAIPSNLNSYKSQKIGLLCNFKDGEIDVLKQAIPLLGKDVELTLIHINTANETLRNIDQKFNEFIKKVILETGIDDISYIIKAQTFFAQHKEDISSAINSVISDELLDVLLITKSKKSFLRKIIEENVVKRMAYDIRIPTFFGKS